MKTRLITLLVAIFAIIGSANAQKTVKVYKNGEVVYSEYITDIDSIKFEEQTAPLPNTHNGHEYVDLGLPSGIKWATCNIGADTPEEYGDYFAWGETQPKDYYDWSTYKYCNYIEYSMTKYCVDSYYGTVDNKTTLEPSDDAVRVNWGGSWRMPTKAEQDELRNTSNCTWTWTIQNGVKGYKVTSVKNGNSIFLPAAGYRFDEGHNDVGLIDAGSSGGYWSSSLGTSNGYNAYYLGFGSSIVNWYDKDRCRGRSVRAVCLEGLEPLPIYTITVSSNGTMGTAISSASEAELGGTVTLTATPNDGYCFLNWTVNGKVVSIENPYTAIITADTEFKANFRETCKPTGTENGHAYVDLGLPSGLKWATCNVGADTPEEYGDYFAWGETEPKTTYNWSTYKYCNGDEYSMTKYCEDSEYGTVDKKNTLELSDDAARVNWGGKWRMPTETEQGELYNTSNCTWTWTSQNGVKGYNVTSKKNGNSIFLPAAGSRYDLDLYNAGSKARYWSNSLESYSHFASSLYFDSNSVDWDYGYRDVGQPVRAVCE